MKKILSVLAAFVLCSTTASQAVEISTLQIAGTRSKVWGFLQGWSIDSAKETAALNHSYRLRRLELHLDTSLSDEAAIFLAIDPARFAQPSSNATPVPFGALFLDFGAKYAFLPGLELKAGQFKTPTTAEGLDSTKDLSLPERSLVGRTLGDIRAVGVQLSYKTETYKLSSMLSSGQTVIGPTPFSMSELATRFEWKPFKGLGFGTFFAIGDLDYDKRGRVGVNARCQLNSVDFQTEYAQAIDRGIQSRGATAQVGYWVTELLQPVFRVEAFRPNTGSANVASAQTIGINYFLAKPNARVQLAASSLQNMLAVNGTPIFTAGTDSKVITVGIQASI